jgi:hypothetical protein
MSMDFSDEESMVLRRALYGYAQWCRDRACACAQKTGKAPPEAVGRAFEEEDRANALLKRFRDGANHE